MTKWNGITQDICEGNHRSPVDSTLKCPVMRSIDDFLVLLAMHGTGVVLRVCGYPCSSEQERWLYWNTQ